MTNYPNCQRSQLTLNFNMVTNSELKQQLDAFSARIEKSIADNHVETGKKIDGLTARLDAFDARIKELEGKSQENEERIDEIGAQLDNSDEKSSEKFIELTKRIEELEEKMKKLEDVPASIKKITENVEDRTNRQLRETLVFKNLPEVNEKESFNDTKKLLATTISENCDGVTYDEAYRQIKRAHRESGHRTDENGEKIREGKRHIFAALHSWDLCQTIIETFREKGIKDGTFQIYADQKYGPITNKRRLLAIELKNKLKKDGVITSGFIEFPAKLMVNYPGQFIGKKKIYRLHTNFSKHDV